MERKNKDDGESVIEIYTILHDLENVDESTFKKRIGNLRVHNLKLYHKQD